MKQFCDVIKSFILQIKDKSESAIWKKYFYVLLCMYFNNLTY